MKIDSSFFRSKLAQRIFLMFVACALLPIAGLFILSFIQVNKQLYQQNHKRLKQSAKAYGLSVYERLLFLEEEMLLCVTAMNAESSADIHKIPDEELKMRLSDRFRGFFVYQQGKGYRSFFGESKNIPGPDAAQLEHIGSGNTALLTQHGSDVMAAMAKWFVAIRSGSELNRTFPDSSRTQTSTSGGRVFS